MLSIGSGVSKAAKNQWYTFKNSNIEDKSEMLTVLAGNIAMLAIPGVDEAAAAEEAAKAGEVISNVSKVGEVAEEAGADFASESKFIKHYNKHVLEQGEFGNISSDEYLQNARDFINSSGEDVLTRTASNGDVLKYNTATDEFSIVTEDNVIRTYYKLNPEIHGYETNMDYWNGPECNY